MNHRFLSAALTAVALFVPVRAQADVELFFESAPQVRQGQPFPVLLKARLQEPINALKTVIRFDPSQLTITGADDNESIIRYWLSRPQSSASGSLTLEGVIPGGVGPGFTDTVLIAHLTLLASHTGTSALRLDDSVVYLNQPNPQETKVTVRPLTLSVRSDTPDIVTAGMSGVEDDAYVRVIHEPSINEGAWSLVFDVRTASGSMSTVFLREQRFGFGGSWRPVMNTERLSDQTRTSILQVAVPDGTSKRIVRTIVPARLKILWVLVGMVILALLCMFFRRRKT